MKQHINSQDGSMDKVFETYEVKFKAIADKKRLQIMTILSQENEICVGDLAELLDLTQSKLSYHLKILLDANIIKKDTKGTWCYYQLNLEELNHLLSHELYSLFQPTS